MTATLTQAETQVSLALDAIQSKRRIEHVLDAATALLDRVAARPDMVQRLSAGYELIRRNFAPDVELAYDQIVFGDADREPVATGAATFRVILVGPDGAGGSMTASYTPPGQLGLTVEEWRSALTLLCGVLALAIGARVVCP